MVQTLFEERFKLVLSREVQQAAAYDLVVGKNGPKMHEVNSDSEKADGAIINGFPFGGPGSKGVAMSQLADFLYRTPFIGRPVIDKTGLKGIYEFKLDFSRAPGDGAPDVFTALQEQLGLKLESTKAQIEKLVVRRIERPSEN